MIDDREELVMYRDGFFLLMDFWEFFPEDKKDAIHEVLCNIGL